MLMDLFTSLALAGLLLIALGFGLIYSVRYWKHHLSTTNVTIRLDNMANQHGGKDIVVAHLSDFHYDFGAEDYLDPLLTQILDTLRSAPAIDFIFLTGDFVNRDPTPINSLTQKFICHLPPLASSGVFACMGNHDGYTSLGIKTTSSQDYITAALQSVGVQVLRNECKSVDGIKVCGLDDLWSFSPKRDSGWLGHPDAMESLSSGNREPRLLLSHNPDTADLLSKYEYDVQFSGHTHGGQVCLPRWITFPRQNPHATPVLGLVRAFYDLTAPRIQWISKLFKRFRQSKKFMFVVDNWKWSEGHHVVPGKSGATDRHLIVSRGLGSHENLRIFCPPELCFVTITS